MLYDILTWLLVGALSALFNLTPILAPPTLGLLAYFNIQHDLPALPLAIVGATGATLGRLLLALASRRFGPRLIPAQRRENLERATAALSERKRFSLPLLAMFAVGPVPKALLFMAAGIARVPLAPGALVFGFARSVIYLVTLTAVGSATSSFEGLLVSPLGNPVVIVAQLIGVVGVIALFRLDWLALLERWRAARTAATPRSSRSGWWLLKSRRKTGVV